MLLASCGGGGASDGTATTSTTEAPPPDVSGLQCDAGGEIAEVAIDHLMDAGVATPEEALDLFFGSDGSIAEGLAIHPDDAVITPGDTRFVDGGGRVVLLVHIEGLPGGWVVSGYSVCS